MDIVPRPCADMRQAQQALRRCTCAHARIGRGAAARPAPCVRRPGPHGCRRGCMSTRSGPATPQICPSAPSSARQHCRCWALSVGLSLTDHRAGQCAPQVQDKAPHLQRPPVQLVSLHSKPRCGGQHPRAMHAFVYFAAGALTRCRHGPALGLRACKHPCSRKARAAGGRGRHEEADGGVGGA